MPRQTRIYGLSVSTATPAICLPCKTRSRAASPLLSMSSSRRRRPLGQPTTPMYWTIFFVDVLYLLGGRHRARAEAIALLERALALDPQSVEAQVRLSSALAGRVINNMTDAAAADLTRAEGLAEQA